MVPKCNLRKHYSIIAFSAMLDDIVKKEKLAILVSNMCTLEIGNGNFNELSCGGNACIVLPGTYRSLGACVRNLDTYFNLSSSYHLLVLFVEISYQARFCLQISYPAILCIYIQC